MPRKEHRLLLRDLLFLVTGSADVRAADWQADPWIYPADWGFQLDRPEDYFEPRDGGGIPLREFPPPIGPRYLPSRVAAFALANWNRPGGAARDAAFLATAEWFRTTADDGRYRHDFPLAGMATGWLSCIAQGEAASVLCRAWQRTGDDGYRHAAERAVHWLTVPVAQGGLLDRLPDGHPFLEEYPGTGYRHVLNGCLYAMVGIHDLLRSSAEARLRHQDLFNALIDAVGTNLPAWDLNGWSSYDFDPRPGIRRNANTMTYQVVQSILLRYLADASGDQRLRATADRWQAAAGRFPARMHALLTKIRYRAAAGW